MSNYNGTAWEGTLRKGIKQTCSCAGNVVQVFGFKNIFIEAGYNGIVISENFFCPTPTRPMTWKALLQFSRNKSYEML